jgi:NCAIR mutase (PurE)-related protein
MTGQSDSGDAVSSSASAILDLGFARLDLDREHRQGLPEVVYGPGKTAGQITAIVAALLANNTGPVLATRIDADVARAVLGQLAGRHTSSRGCGLPRRGGRRRHLRSPGRRRGGRGRHRDRAERDRRP